eukprot:scaffold108406_cov57-Phaeocystis_antarctica.AAC.2
MSIEETRQQAQAEGLTLLVADNKTARPGQALPGGFEPRWQDGVPGQLRHCRGGGAARRTVAGGAGSSGGAGCSGGAADERGGAAASTGGGAPAACCREHDGLLRRRSPRQQVQALRGAGEARWHAREPGHVRHRPGGGAARRAIAGGAGGGAKASGAYAADERGGAAAGAGGEADTARGREQDGLLRRQPRKTQPVQALPGINEPRWQELLPGRLRNCRGGGAMRRAIAGGADGSGGAGCSGGAADERGGAAAGAGGGADAAGGRD